MIEISKHPRIKFYLLNLLAAVVIILIIGYIVLFKLDSYTMHGHFISVPAFYNLTEAEAIKLAEQNNLRVMVTDSLYDEEVLPGNILEQYPASGAKVKDNRMIRLTVNAHTPEQVTLPDLKNSPYRQTIQTLEAKGFKIGHVEYMPSDFKNLVLNLKYNNNFVSPGILLKKGAVIGIVLGDGNDGENRVSLPDLSGLRIKDAISRLKQNYLNVKAIIPDATIQDKIDNLTAIVYQQEPAYHVNQSLEAGSYVTLYITLDKKRIINPDSLMVTSN